MTTVRIALANVRIAGSRDEALEVAERAVAEAGEKGAAVVCFPEAYLPGYRCFGWKIPAPDAAWLEAAWQRMGAAAKRAGIGVVLGTERIVEAGTMITALVINPDGTRAGWQDKVQLDPSEDTTYVPGRERRVFTMGPLTFGVVICHEGWRYPETVRWAARRGAQLVFHPHLHIKEPGSYVPASFGDPKNSFHEKAMLCRAAENTVYFASINCASDGSGTTSAIARPDGTLLAAQPYGKEGLLVADLDLDAATGLLAKRSRYSDATA